jgi:hypothetical protein
MSISNVIVGGLGIFIGLPLLSLPIFFGLGGFVSWIYGLPLFVIGIVILLNDKEDVIEERKDKVRKNVKNK